MHATEATGTPWLNHCCTPACFDGWGLNPCVKNFSIDQNSLKTMSDKIICVDTLLYWAPLTGCHPAFLRSAIFYSQSIVRLPLSISPCYFIDGGKDQCARIISSYSNNLLYRYIVHFICDRLCKNPPC